MIKNYTRIVINGICKECGSNGWITCTMPDEIMSDYYCSNCGKELSATDRERFLQIARSIYNHKEKNKYLKIDNIEVSQYRADDEEETDAWDELDADI